MRRFEFVDSTSNKFWEVDVKGKTLNVTFGKIGTKGQSKPKDFATPEKANTEMEKLIKEKTGKGYVEVGGKAVKEAKPAGKSAAAKKSSAGGMGKELSKAEKKAKVEKLIAMYVGGQWELARGMLEAAQEEHWLFEELLEGCKVEDGIPVPSIVILGYLENECDESIKAELLMLEFMSHLPKDLEELQKMRDELGLKFKANMLSKYWKEIAKDKFEGVKYGGPVNFSDRWYEDRAVKIVGVEKACEERGRVLKLPWIEEIKLSKNVNMEMLLVPSSEFMGKEFNFINEYDFSISKHFYLGKFAVTQEQWEAVMKKNPSRYKGPKLPVNNVSWYSCQEFIQKLNAKTKGGYRLPTEAEWEYACRAGTNSNFLNEIKPNSLNAKSPLYMNIGSSNLKMPIDVGSYVPNAFGFYDMLGNVWEWCKDWFAYESGVLGEDPKGPKNEYSFERTFNKHTDEEDYGSVDLDHVLRGKSFKSGVINGSENRRSPDENSRDESHSAEINWDCSDFGFRLARTI